MKQRWTSNGWNGLSNYKTKQTKYSGTRTKADTSRLAKATLAFSFEWKMVRSLQCTSLCRNLKRYYCACSENHKTLAFPRKKSYFFTIWTRFLEIKQPGGNAIARDWKHYSHKSALRFSPVTCHNQIFPAIFFRSCAVGSIQPNFLYLTQVLFLT